MTTLPLRVLHADIDLTTTGDQAEELHERLGELWSACRRDVGRPTEGAFPLTVRLRPPGSGPGVLAVEDPDRLPTAVSQTLVRLAIESGVSRLLMLHAAGIADPTTGAAAVCVARGGTGKTTLCRTLGAGRRYLTDETVALHPDGRIVAFPKPLSVRRPGQEVKDEVSPGEAGLLTDGAEPWLSALLLLRRDPHHRGAPEVTELGLLDTIVALCEETSSLDRLDRPLQLLADVLGRIRPALAVTYAEVSSLEPLMDQLIGPAQVVSECPR